MAKTLNDRFYSESHEWLLVDGDTATVGITDFAQSELGDLVYAESEPEGSVIEKGGIFGSIESVKMATDLYLPVDGEILEVNEELNDSPEKINEDAFGSWFVKIKITNPDQVKELMDGPGYEAMISKEG